MKHLIKGFAGVGAAALAAVFLASGAMAGPVDTDGDGIPDSADNCILNANTPQTDSDGDGCGNVCDADFDQSGVAAPADAGIFGGTCWAGVTVPPALAVCDCNNDNSIGAADAGCFGASYNRPSSQFNAPCAAAQGCPGPSAFPGVACFQ